LLLRRFYDTKLAQASWLVGCQASDVALIVDPNRDVEQYMAAAAGEGMKIALVTETHIHADFVSGSRELAARTGATLVLSDEGGPEWSYAFAKDSGARLVGDGDVLKLGNIRIEVMHTPGHTPEHLSFMVTDGAATDRPMGVFTGDFVFVGDVGRPDLLERAAGYEGTMEAGARTLFRSLQRFKELPDYLQIWPGHGAGSACGKALGAVPQSTLGYERFANWGLATVDEAQFVRLVLEGQPDPPRYFAQMKRLNREGPRLLHGVKRPERLPVTGLAGLLAAGAVVVDTRRSAEYARRFIPGTINIPLNSAFTTWAGWLLSYDRPFYLIVDDTREHQLEEACRDLAMIGLDRVEGWFGGDALTHWREASGSLEELRQVAAQEVERLLAEGEAKVVDVRARAEWEAGHLPGVENHFLGYLQGHMEALPRDREVVLHCESGSRSAIAASLLRAAGFGRVANFAGGYVAWTRAGLPVERGTAAPVVTPT
jgi:hydroxyacylglutathione hydrolase